MKEEGMENNRACVIGKMMSEFSYSHEVFGERFFRTDILVCRTSGILDTVPLMFPEKLADVNEDYSDNTVEITGQFRSYNRKEDGKSHLELSVFVQEIRFLDGEYTDYGSNNCVCLKGFLCRPPAYRKTPLGRRICDILLAVNRLHGKSDYIPCIAWGRDAVLASRLNVGSAVEVMGRIQSREYTKKQSETETEIRVAYEVSVCRMEAVDVWREDNGAGQDWGSG